MKTADAVFISFFLILLQFSYLSRIKILNLLNVILYAVCRSATRVVPYLQDDFEYDKMNSLNLIK